MSHSTSRKEITKRLFVLALAYFIFAIYCDGYDDERSSRYLSEKTVPLEFVHISHTGGVEIETLAANQANLNWGACHWRTIEEENCMDPDQAWYTSPDVNTKNYALHNIWHTPPKDLMSVIEPKQNPYTDKDLFTIVRNPYAKIISEFYCPWNGYGKSDKNEAATLNAWVMDKLKAFSDQSVEYKKFLKDHSQQRNGTILASGNVSKVYEKHFTSQFEYVYGNEGERIIQNVLHFEDIKSEFKSLMKKYDLTIKLPLQIQESSGKLSHLDLYPETIAQINEIFRPDFEAFGYEMVETFDGRAYSLRSLSNPCMQYKVGVSECKRDEGITVDTKKFNAPIGLPHATTFFMGIQTELTEKGANDRDRIRKTYLSINDARLCSWEEYKNQHDSSGGRIVPCRVPYAFIVGGIPDVPLEQGRDKPVSVNRSLLEGEKDVLVLDIKDDIKVEREKVFAFFKWASSIGSEYHLDFVASVQTGTLIDMQGLFSFSKLRSCTLVGYS